MITTEFTKDAEIVAAVYRRLEDVIGDEHSPSVDEVDWDWHFRNDVFVLAKYGAEVAGVVAFYYRGGDTWDAHMNMLPEHRGAKSQAAFAQGVALLREATGAKKLVTSVPKRYPNVIAFVERNGARLTRETDAENFYELELT